MDEFARTLLAWFDDHGRKDLPWQQDRNPYRVWVSEIMLQQTQVATVIPYFERFMAAYPELPALAGADLDDVLAHWSGLGYYSRARNLHRAAQQIMEQHEGRFPNDLEAVIALPGIGRSTAGAILAQALGQPHPILDGNVKRVLCRYYAIEGWPGQSAVHNRLWALAERHTPDTRVADYTQAIMDLGATVCRRSRPTCEACPVAFNCAARKEGAADRYPTSKPRKALPEKETLMVIVEDHAGRLLMEQRPPTGIWGGLWSFPECPPDRSLQDWAASELGLALNREQALPAVAHTFSHFRLRIIPVLARADTDGRIADASLRWHPPEAVAGLGLPAPIRRLLEGLAGSAAETKKPRRTTGGAL